MLRPIPFPATSSLPAYPAELHFQRSAACQGWIAWRHRISDAGRFSQTWLEKIPYKWAARNGKLILLILGDVPLFDIDCQRVNKCSTFPQKQDRLSHLCPPARQLSKTTLLPRSRRRQLVANCNRLYLLTFFLQIKIWPAATHPNNRRSFPCQEVKALPQSLL